jgi:hypothetical protein
MELGHMLTRSILRYPDVSSKFSQNSFCQFIVCYILQNWFDCIAEQLPKLAHYLPNITHHLPNIAHQLPNIVHQLPNKFSAAEFWKQNPLSVSSFCVQMKVYPTIPLKNYISTDVNHFVAFFL